MNVPPPPLPAFPLSAFTSLSAITRLYLADLATMQLITSKLKSRQRTFSLANKFAGRQPGSQAAFPSSARTALRTEKEWLNAYWQSTDRQTRPHQQQQQKKMFSSIPFALHWPLRARDRERERRGRRIGRGSEKAHNFPLILAVRQ